MYAGDTVVVWLDRWQLGNEAVIMHCRFPSLHSYVIDDTITIKDFMERPDLTDNFHLPLSAKAFQEFKQLQSLLRMINLQEEGKDVWKWPSKSGEY